MSRPWLRPAALATALVLVVPVAAGLIGTALPAFGYLPSAGAASVSLDPVKALLNAPGLGRSILLSLGTSLAATLVSLLLVMLLLAGWLDSVAFRWLRRLLAPLLSVPHAAAALGLALVIAPSGFLVRLVAPLSPALSRPPDWLILQDPFGLTLTLGLVLKEVPFLLLLALAALHQIDLRPRLQLAESFGYGRIAAFGHTVAPQLYRQLRLPVLAVLAFSTSVVDMALVLGPSLPATLAVRVVGWIGDPDLAIRMKGAAGALLQLSVSAAALLVWFAGERAIHLVWRSQAIRGNRLARDRIASRSGLAVVLGLVVLAVLGLAVLTLWSLSTTWRYPDLLPSGLTLRHWLQSGPDLNGLIATTLAIGLAVSLTAAALVTALLQERVQGQGGGSAGLDTRLLDGLAFVPLLVPQVAFLFGLQVLFLEAGLDGSLFGVALSHFVFVLPYILLSLRGPWGALDPRYRQVALSLGASEQRVFWRIRLPLMFPAILTAVALGLAISVSQYLPTLLIGGGRVTTVTTEAVALASGGSRPLIAVHALAQILLPFAGFALAAALSRLLLPRLFSRRSS
jgi:putative thiamine transport system permease protein